MALFPRLADPERYRACETDLLRDQRAREHWLTVFAELLPGQLTMAAELGASEATCREVDRQFRAELDALRENPARYARLDILLLDQIRQRIFRSRGIADECRAIKARENELALAALPDRLADLDQHPDDTTRFESLLRGMLAGNLFDMGVKATAERYANMSMTIARALEMVPPRPWRIDDLDAAWQAWLEAPPERAVIFADNAGADLVLGLLPLARFLLQRGVHVVITANESPSHNDITHAELRVMMQRVIAIDETFADPRLELISSGNDAPLIDLREVSPALAAASIDADLVVLVGMGRALETNFSARMTCQCWKVAMIKDAAVAHAIGGEVFDAVFRFDPPVS